jgi:hypothetical protein
VSGDAELIADSLATLEELAEVYTAAVAQVVDLVQDRTGQRLVTGRPGILDAGIEDLARMETQAEHYLAAMKLIRSWLRPSETVPLGHRLKVIPAEQAERITGHLRAAGLLP